MYTYTAVFENGTKKTIEADSRFWALDEALYTAKLRNTTLVSLNQEA